MPKSHINNPIADLVALFRTDLGEVSFPGIDATVLERLVAQVEQASDAREQARQALAAAEVEVAQAQEALRSSAEQGLAYAKVFAAGNAELAERLDRIALGKKTAPRKRKRTKKAQATKELPLGAAA